MAWLASKYYRGSTTELDLKHNPGSGETQRQSSIGFQASKKRTSIHSWFLMLLASIHQYQNSYLNCRSNMLSNTPPWQKWTLKSLCILERHFHSIRVNLGSREVIPLYVWCRNGLLWWNWNLWVSRTWHITQTLIGIPKCIRRFVQGRRAGGLQKHERKIRWQDQKCLPWKFLMTSA